MFGNLFSGMNIHEMNVNFNFGNNMDMFNPNTRKEHVPMLGNPSNPVLPGTTPMQIPYQSENVEVQDIPLMTFGKILINNKYELQFSNDFDFKTKPIKEESPMNKNYFITHMGDDPDYFQYSDLVGEITNRKNDYPPILKLLDHDRFEDKEKLDQMIYHTSLLSTFYEFNSFFLIIEESGDMLEGDPEPTTFDCNKSLFRKTIYSISIK